MRTADLRRLSHLTRFVEAAAARGEIPGAVLLVVQHGEVVLEHAFGVRDPASGGVMVVDALFRLYSMSKAITAVAALRLAERGELVLQTELARYLPAFAAARVLDERHLRFTEPGQLTRSPYSPILVFDLLRHTAGFADEVFHPGYAGEHFRRAGIGSGRLTLAEAVERAATIPLLFDPGTHFSYAETSYTTLGRVLEAVTGCGIDEVLRREVFQPLGMTETGFDVPPGQEARIAEPIPLSADKGRLDGLFDAHAPRAYHSPATGLIGTARDYARFVRMLLRGGRTEGGDVFLSPATVDAILSDSLGGTLPGFAYFFDNVMRGFTWGLGLGVRDASAPSPMLAGRGTFLWGGAGGTMFFGDRDHQYGVVLMIQQPEFLKPNLQTIGTLAMQALV